MASLAGPGALRSEMAAKVFKASRVASACLLKAESDRTVVVDVFVEDMMDE